MIFISLFSQLGIFLEQDCVRSLSCFITELAYIVVGVGYEYGILLGSKQLHVVVNELQYSKKILKPGSPGQ